MDPPSLPVLLDTPTKPRHRGMAFTLPPRCSVPWETDDDQLATRLAAKYSLRLASTVFSELDSRVSDMLGQADQMIDNGSKLTPVKTPLIRRGGDRRFQAHSEHRHRRRSGRFSQIHTHQFHKMDSIGLHYAALRLRNEPPNPPAVVSPPGKRARDGDDSHGDNNHGDENDVDMAAAAPLLRTPFRDPPPSAPHPPLSPVSAEKAAPPPLPSSPASIDIDDAEFSPERPKRVTTVLATTLVPKRRRTLVGPQEMPKHTPEGARLVQHTGMSSEFNKVLKFPREPRQSSATAATASSRARAVRRPPLVPRGVGGTHGVAVSTKPVARPLQPPPPPIKRKPLHQFQPPANRPGLTRSTGVLAGMSSLLNPPRLPRAATTETLSLYRRRTGRLLPPASPLRSRDAAAPSTRTVRRVESSRSLQGRPAWR